MFAFLIILNVFLGGFVLLASSFEFYVGYLFIAGFLIGYLLKYGRIPVNNVFLITLSVFTLFSFINVYIGHTTTFSVLKQILGISITGTAYYLLLKVNDFRIERLFNVYLRIATLVALIGIVQEFSYLIGFSAGYDYSWLISKWKYTATAFGVLRVNSIFSEPSHFAISMAPALFVSLAAILKNSFSLSKKSCVLIVVSYLLTFSTVAYIAVFISALLLFSNNKKSLYSLLAVGMVLLLVYGAYRFVPEIGSRVDDTFAVGTRGKDASDVNLSTYALTSNAYVAYKSFCDSPIFGRGFGSHPWSYDEFLYSGASVGLWRDDALELNREDANSLFLRLLSETGLVGVLLVLYFLFKFRVRCDNNKNIQVISNAIFIMLFLQVLRQGHYFYNGLFFFVWMYYYAYRSSTAEKLHAEIGVYDGK